MRNMCKTNARYRHGWPMTGIFLGSVVFFCACNKAVKITLIQAVLEDSILLKFAFRKCFCNLCGDLALILQDLRIVELQECIQLGCARQ